PGDLADVTVEDARVTAFVAPMKLPETQARDPHRRYAIEAAGDRNGRLERKLRREAGKDVFLGGRLAGLVVDDREPAVQLIDTVGPRDQLEPPRRPLQRQ